MTTSRIDRLIEYFVRVQIYVLAAFYALKELYFEASNQGIATKLNAEIGTSPIVQRNKKVALITGADGTIGLEITRRLLALGFDVKALVKTRKNSPLDDLVKEYSKEQRLTLYEVDFERPHDVVRFTDTFVNFGAVHLVVLSAGIMLAREKYIEEMESHMCVNLISQAMILDRLSEHLSSDSRIIALSSTCLRAAYNQRQLEEGLLQTYHGPYHAYAMSKLALSIYLEELAARQKLFVATLHPGVIPGRLYRNLNIILKLITYIFLPFVMRTPTFSSQLVLHTALRRDFVPGAYYEDQEVKDVLAWYSDIQKDAVYNQVTAKINELCK